MRESCPGMTVRDSTRCVRCDAALAPGANFCPSCGAPVVDPPDAVGPRPTGTVPPSLPSNPQRRAAVIWFLIALVGIGGAVVPFFTDMDMVRAGNGLVVLGVLVALTGLITAIVYLARGAALTRVLTTERLVYWRYDPEEWARFAEVEHERRKGRLTALFVTIVLVSLVVGGVVLLADPDEGRVVLVVLALVVGVCGLTALLSGASARRRNRARIGDAFVATSGVYLNRVLHSWQGFGARLDRVTYEGGSPSCIEFEYSMPARTGRQSECVRVPVPSGQEECAAELVAQFQALTRA